MRSLSALVLLLLAAWGLRRMEVWHGDLHKGWACCQSWVRAACEQHARPGALGPMDGLWLSTWWHDSQSQVHAAVGSLAPLSEIIEGVQRPAAATTGCLAHKREHENCSAEPQVLTMRAAGTTHLVAVEQGRVGLGLLVGRIEACLVGQKPQMPVRHLVTARLPQRQRASSPAVSKVGECNVSRTLRWR